MVIYLGLLYLPEYILGESGLVLTLSALAAISFMGYYCWGVIYQKKPVITVLDWWYNTTGKWVGK